MRSSGLIAGGHVPGVSVALDYAAHPDGGLARLPEMHLANMAGSGLAVQVTHGSPFTAKPESLGALCGAKADESHIVSFVGHWSLQFILIISLNQVSSFNK